MALPLVAAAASLARWRARWRGNTGRAGLAAVAASPASPLQPAGAPPRPAGAPPVPAGRRPLSPGIPPGETGGPTFPPEPTPSAEPRSARWQGWPAGGFSAGHLRSPCQKEGAEGLRSSSASGREEQCPVPYAGQARCRVPERRQAAARYCPPGAPLRGCRGFLPLTIPMWPGSPAEAEWQSGGDASPAATLTRSR